MLEIELKNMEIIINTMKFLKFATENMEKIIKILIILGNYSIFLKIYYIFLGFMLQIQN